MCQFGLVDEQLLQIRQGGQRAVAQHHQRVPGEHENLELLETSEHRREDGADLVVTQVEFTQIRQSIERAGLKQAFTVYSINSLGLCGMYVQRSTLYTITTYNDISNDQRRMNLHI